MRIVLKLFVMLAALLTLGACESGGSNQSTTTNSVQGYAVKGPLVNASLSMYLVDLNAADLKGALIASGSTDGTGKIVELQLPDEYLESEQFLLEFTGGTELDGSIPVIPTLKTLINSSDALVGSRVFATPVTTFIIESVAQTQRASDLTGLNAEVNSTAETVKNMFGLGLIGEDESFFNSAPILLDGYDPAISVKHRVVNEVLAALVAQTTQLIADEGIDVNADVVFQQIVKDLSDGSPDGLVDGEPLDMLAAAGLSRYQSILTQDPEALAALIVPGTDIPVSEIARLLLSEAQHFNSTPPVDPLPMPTLGNVVAGADTDGDGAIDVIDVCADDPFGYLDSDGDGYCDTTLPYEEIPIFSKLDHFPDDASEWGDHDLDRIGNNSDADFSGDDDGDGVQNGEETPYTYAGEDRFVAWSKDGFIQIDGSETTDDDTGLVYAWQLVSVPPFSQLTTANILAADAPMASLDFDFVGNYVFELTVTDPEGYFSTDQVEVYVAKGFPTASVLYGSSLLGLACLFAPGLRRRKRMKV